MSQKMKRKFQPPMGTSLPSNPMVPSNNLLDFGGEPKIETEDWRSQLQPDSRQQVINKIMWTMKRHQPVYHEEGLNELRKDTERFEAKIFADATSLLDYLRKTSEKVTMGTKSQPPVGTSLPYNPMVTDNKPLDFGGISGIVTGDLLSQPQPNRQRQIFDEMYDFSPSSCIIVMARIFRYS